jgi:hypothetical protein
VTVLRTFLLTERVPTVLARRSKDKALPVPCGEIGEKEKFEDRG